MRPPHYTGENAVGESYAPRIIAASMRPPHYTGENIEVVLAVVALGVASMRPPHYTGENLALHGDQVLLQGLQ